MIWAGVAFLVIVAVAMVITSRQLAHLHSMTFGGNVAPGCVTAEAGVLLLVALVMVIAHVMGVL